MERTTSSTTNFLGLGPPKDLRPILVEHRASCTADAAIYMPTSGIHRPVPSKLPTQHQHQHQQQQFMSFRPVQEDGHNKRTHGDVRMSGFHSVMSMGVSDANNIHRVSAPMSQKNFSRSGMQSNSFTSFLHLTNKHSFPLPSHPSRAAPNSSSPQLNNNSHVHHYPYGLPGVNGNGFVGSPQSPFPAQYPPPTLPQQHRVVVGAPGLEASLTCAANVGYNPRNTSQPLPTTGQLTIFFGGMVNVYENVSLEKVQAIMSMASSGSDTSPENSNAARLAPMVHTSRVRPADPPARVKPSEPVMIRHPPPQTNTVSHFSGLCSPTSAASPSVDYSAGSSNTPDEPNSSKSGSKSPTPTENKVSAEDESGTKTTPMSKAVPMARKASLARFLEKRKERILHLAPYPSVQKPSDGSGIGIKAMGSFIDNHSTKPIKFVSGAKGQPWHPSRTSNAMDANFVNTELEI